MNRAWPAEGRVGSRLGLALCVSISMGAIAHASDVDVVLDEARGSCRVRGSFIAPVSRGVAWQVLTDYDGIGAFVHSMRSSRMERQADGRVLLRQEAVGGVFLVRRRMQVLLELEEAPGTRIGFHDVFGKDFRRYAGEWRISADSMRTRVEYELEAEPRAALARMFCRGTLRGTARDLLSQVRAEMIRRAGPVR